MRACRTDANQTAIATAARRAGATVESLHRVGGGVPDLLVGFAGVTMLWEVKAAKGRVSSTQTRWHDEWTGRPVTVVRSVEQAVEILRFVRAEVSDV